MPQTGSWKDPFLTVTFPSKVIFIIASWLLFVINTGVIIGDLYHFLVSQRGDLMSFRFTVSLLVKGPSLASSAIQSWGRGGNR
ncbi:hypothetical protein E2320_013768 [Naja naja]|nr:hypothetical protein E2320_013768 [Naja naja]